MLSSPRASDTPVAQELVFDTHLKKILSFIGLMLTKLEVAQVQRPELAQLYPNVATLKNFQERLNQHPRDLFGLKAQTISFLAHLNQRINWFDLILTFSDYLDHELTLMECFVSKIEELRQEYLKQKRGWHEAAVSLGARLADSRSKKDLSQLKAMLLEFCEKELVSFSGQSKTFKPSLEAIANAIPLNEFVLAASSSLSSQTMQSVREELQRQESNCTYVIGKFAVMKVEHDETKIKLEEQAAATQSLRLQLQKSEATTASLSLELSLVSEQLAALKLKEASKQGGFFENLFSLSSDSEDKSPKPILHAQKAAAKGAPAPRVPSKASLSTASTATPPALKMEDTKRAANSNGAK